MRKFIVFVAVVIFLLLLCGCGMITSGEVTGKNFVPAHEKTTMVPTTDFDGNITLQSQTDWIPDRWYVTFEKVDEDNRLKSRTVSVDENVYENTKVGDWFALER